MGAVKLVLGCNWTDSEGNNYTGTPFAGASGGMMMAGNVVNCGYLLIPDQSAQGAEFDLPFQGVAQGATYVMIANQSGQELNMAWGGNWFPHLPAGGLLLWAFPAIPQGGQITSLRFMLTQAQNGLGKIKYIYCGS